MLGGAAVNNDVRDTSLGRDQRERSGRVDRETGAESDDEIACHGGFFGSVDVFLPQVLAEADSGLLQKPSTLAERWAFRFGKLPEMIVRVYCALSIFDIPPAHWSREVRRADLSKCRPFGGDRQYSA